MEALICENCKAIHLAPKVTCECCKSTSLVYTDSNNLETVKLFDIHTVKDLLHECWIASTRKTLDPISEKGFGSFLKDNFSL